MSVGGLSHPLFPNPDEFGSFSRMQRRMRGDEPTQDDQDEEVSTACRSLFGSAADPPEKAHSQLEKLKATQRERWNFDFDTETPLPGRYQWVRVQSTTVPNGGCDIDLAYPGRTPVIRSKAEDASLPPTTAQPTEQASQGGGAARALKQAEVTRYLKKQKCKRSFKTVKPLQSPGSHSVCPSEVFKNPEKFCIASLTVPKFSSHFPSN